MAILKGFPPSNTVSPSVRITEKDGSFIAAEQSLHAAGLVGFASKGPVNVPTLITTRNQLATVFGYPHPESGDPYMYYAAQLYLNVASELYVVRVAETDNVSDEFANTAYVDVNSAGGQVRIESLTAGPYTFTADSFFRWRLNGVLAVNTPVVLKNPVVINGLTKASYTIAELVEELNAQVDPDVDGIEFYVTDGTHTAQATNTLGVRTTFSYGPNATLELVSVQNSIYGGAVGTSNITGLGTGMTPASVIGDATYFPASYPTVGQFDFGGYSNLTLQIVVDGTDNTLIDNVVQTIALPATKKSIADWASYINDLKTGANALPGGWTAYATQNTLEFRTDHCGIDARILVKSDSTAAAYFGLDSDTHSGTTPVGNPTSLTTVTASYGKVSGVSADESAVTFQITADSAGIDGNATQVQIANDVRNGTFTMTVYNNGVQVENWGGLTKDETSTYYVATYLPLVSDWVRVIDTDNTAPPNNGWYSLSGGSDGIPSEPDRQDALIIGNPLGYTGLYALSEPEQIDIDLIAAPGHASTAVVNALLDVCQNYRMDCLAIIDPPFGLTVQEIIAWQNGTHPLNNDRFDSDFGALYWPWVKIRDTYNLVDIWAPPSGAVMTTIAHSDAISAPWYAPAGINRGVVQGITDVFSRPTLAERDLMYGYRNCINPIVQFVNVQGFVIWGQKTLQRTPTALDRVNVRRLMFYIEKRIRVAARQLLFDPHDQQLEQAFVRIATAILTEVQVGRGITDFRVKCDSELNTADVIDRNELRARIGVQPTKAAEFIFIEFSIHRTGDFADMGS